MNLPAIQIENLHLALSGTPILNGISLSVSSGEYLSIVGPNGAGKTSLIKCLAGIYSNWTGTLRIHGEPAKEYDSKALARVQSYVPQAQGRFSPSTVEEFVAMGRYPHLSAFSTMQPEDYAAIDAAIQQAGLEPLRRRKLDTLSGGERQMAFIAAALAQESKILLLDEPATFLDYRHQAEVVDLLRTACAERHITILAVHHDINLALASSHRILALKSGRVCFEGSPEETASAELLERIYDTPFRTICDPRASLPFVIPEGVK